VCLQHSDEEDPIRLLEKLRGVASSTIAVEMADLFFEELGTLRQGSEDDTTYLGRYKQLVTSMDSVPMPNIPQEWKITRLIKGLGQQHGEIQLQLRMSSAETLSRLTAEDIDVQGIMMDLMIPQETQPGQEDQVALDIGLMIRLHRYASFVVNLVTGRTACFTRKVRQIWLKESL
jgi:hypothetical protein